MINAISDAAMISNCVLENTGKFMWHQAFLYVSRLYEKRSPTSLNRAIALLSPYMPWDGALNNTVAVTRWAAAVSATPYTEEVGRSVVVALFQIGYIDFLRPRIPNDLWGVLKNQPLLPPMYHGIDRGGNENVVAYVRRLGDIDILTSYFLLVWREMFVPNSDITHAMERSIREDFAGTEMEQRRKNLIERLDDILGGLEQALDHPINGALYREGKKQYTKLKDALLEVDKL